MIRGVDFSHWQAKLSTDKLKAAGIAFAIVKAGEVYIKTIGKPAVKDDMHDRNIRELKRSGIICGDYYYFHPSAGASKQARHYAQIRDANIPDLPPVIDIEDTDGYKPLDVGKQLLAFIAEVQTRTGRQPIIYSRNGFLVNQAGNPDWPAGTLFWIARYGLTIGDLSPKIKPGVVIWQYTDKLAIPGCPKLDGNQWLRSQEELNKLAIWDRTASPIGEESPPTPVVILSEAKNKAIREVIEEINKYKGMLGRETDIEYYRGKQYAFSVALNILRKHFPELKDGHKEAEQWTQVKAKRSRSIPQGSRSIPEE